MLPKYRTCTDVASAKQRSLEMVPWSASQTKINPRGCAAATVATRTLAVDVADLGALRRGGARSCVGLARTVDHGFIASTQDTAVSFHLPEHKRASWDHPPSPIVA